MALGLAMFATAAAAAAYVSDAMPDLKPEDKVVVANPQPVQLIFQFQTKGAPNAQATKYVKQQVIDTVKASGLFSSVSDMPTPNGAILSISINDIVSPEDVADAEGKGVVTGATFFVVGSNVADHYLCTVDYVAGPTAPKIEKTARHAVIIQLGMINSAPQHAVKIGSAKDAVFTMVRQIISNPLNEVAKDPNFAGASPSAPTTASPTSTDTSTTSQTTSSTTTPATSGSGSGPGSSDTGAGSGGPPATSGSTHP